MLKALPFYLPLDACRFVSMLQHTFTGVCMISWIHTVSGFIMSPYL